MPPPDEKRQARSKRKAPVEKAASAERPPKKELASLEERPPNEERSTPSSVVEDLKPDWNGPLPSFLSVGAA